MKRKHIKLPPVNIRKLIAHQGSEKTSTTLGLSETAIKKYLKDDAAPKATEIAAQLILASNDRSKKTVVISGSNELIDIVHRIANASDGSVVEIV